MRRRAMMVGLSAALAGTGAGAFTRSVGADAGNLDRHGALLPLRLRFADGAFVTFTAFYITEGSGQWGVTWREGIPSFDEDRIDLGALGGLLRRPFRLRWAEGVPLGTVDRVGTALVARVQRGAIYERRQVVVGAGGLSWELPDRLAPLARSLAQGAEVGALRAGRDGQLLVSLNADPAV